MATRVEGRAPFLSPSSIIRATSSSNSAAISGTVSSTGQPLLLTLVLYMGAPAFIIISRNHKSPGHLNAMVGYLLYNGWVFLVFTIIVNAPGHLFKRESGMLSSVYFFISCGQPINCIKGFVSALPLIVRICASVPLSEGISFSKTSPLKP